MTEPAQPFVDLDVTEDVIKSILGHAGFDAETPPEPATPPAAPEAPEETPEPPAEADPPAPEAPGGPLFPPEVPETPEGGAPGTPESDVPQQAADSGVITLPDGRQVPAHLVQAWLDQAAQPTPVAQLPAVAAPQFQLPQLTEADLEDAGPAVQALLLIANEQAQQMAALWQQVVAAQQVQQQNAEVESAKVANAAASAFQQAYNMPDELMAQIHANVVADDVTRSLAQTRDPFKAVNYALERAYWVTPEARQFEFERQTAHREQAKTRKQKLAGVAGPGGAGPAQPTIDETTVEGRHAAAVQMAREAMYGTETI